MVGQVVDVLVDAASRRRETELCGRTSTNVVVNLPGPREWIGSNRLSRKRRGWPLPETPTAASACPIVCEPDKRLSTS